MISIKRNPNFSNWFQVLHFGNIVEEFANRAKAMKFARNMAKSSATKYIICEGTPYSIKN